MLKCEKNVRYKLIIAVKAKKLQVGGGQMICARHIESIMRLAEACAKMHLRDTVYLFAFENNFSRFPLKI